MDSRKNTGTIAIYGNPNSMIQLSSASLSSDGSLLAAGATPGTVDLWDVTHGKLLKTFDGSDVGVLSRDGRVLATGSISIIETKTLKEHCHAAWRQADANATVNRMHISPGGESLAVTANGLDIQIYETDNCKKIATLSQARDGDFSPDGKLFFAANRQAFTVWQVDGWKLVTTFPAGPDYTTGFAVSPDGQTVLIGGPNNAKLVRVSDGTTVATFGTGWVSGVGFAGSNVVMVRDHQRLSFFATSGQSLCQDEKVESGVLALGGDGSLAVGTLHQRDVMIWSASTIALACNMPRTGSQK